MLKLCLVLLIVGVAVWLVPMPTPPPLPTPKIPLLARCLAEGGQAVRAMLVYVCVPRGASVVSAHAYHVTSHVVTANDTGETLTIISTAYGASELV